MFHQRFGRLALLPLLSLGLLAGACDSDTIRDILDGRTGGSGGTTAPGSDGSAGTGMGGTGAGGTGTAGTSGTSGQVVVGEGESCGGFRAPPQRVCAPGFKCNDVPGRCNGMAADAPGICEAVPQICTKEFRPVCGCDGKTYGNDCMRKSAGVARDHDGECRTGGTGGAGGTGGTPGGGNAGDLCDGIAGFPCDKGLFCEHTAGECRIADGAGKCAPTPQACLTIYKPVCGCDGKTYGNDCSRQTAGVSKDHEGECRTGGTGGTGGTPGGGNVGDLCGGIAGFRCNRGLFCEHNAGECRVADGAGKCAAVPGACTREYRPVCGCDGKTYGNDCTRQVAGVAKDHDGACP